MRSRTRHRRMAPNAPTYAAVSSTPRPVDRQMRRLADQPADPDLGAAPIVVGSARPPSSPDARAGPVRRTGEPSLSARACARRCAASRVRACSACCHGTPYAGLVRDDPRTSPSARAGNCPKVSMIAAVTPIATVARATKGSFGTASGCSRPMPMPANGNAQHFLTSGALIYATHPSQ